MADETPPGSGTPAPETPPAQDELKNFKAEMGRKLENTNAQLQQLLQAIQKPAPAAPTASKKIEDVWYDKPAEAAQMIADQTAATIRKELATQNAAQTRYQSVANQLASDFPELNDPKSDLMTKAQEIYKSLSDEDRSHPLAMKTAVMEAATDLGVRPKGKRTSNDEAFSLGGGSGSGSKRKSAQLEAGQEVLAKLLGVNIDDPKVRERVTNNHGRKYSSWK